MKRVIGRLIEAPLAAAILGGELERGSEVVLEGTGATVRWRGGAPSTATARFEAAE
jgi:hypothetical protein